MDKAREELARDLSVVKSGVGDVDSAVRSLAILAESSQFASLLLSTSDLLPALLGVVARAGPDLSSYSGNSAAGWALIFFMNLAQAPCAVVPLRLSGLVESLSPLIRQDHYHALKAAATMCYLVGFDADGKGLDDLCGSPRALERVVLLLEDTINRRGRDGAYSYGVFTLRSSLLAVRLLSKSDRHKTFLLAGRSTSSGEEGEGRPRIVPLLQRVIYEFVSNFSPGHAGGGGRDLRSACLAAASLYDLSCPVSSLAISPVSSSSTSSRSFHLHSFESSADPSLPPLTSLLRAFSDAVHSRTDALDNDVFDVAAMALCVKNKLEVLRDEAAFREAVSSKQDVAKRRMSGVFGSKEDEDRFDRMAGMAASNIKSSRDLIERQLLEEEAMKRKRDEELRDLDHFLSSGNMTADERRLRLLERELAKQEAKRSEIHLKETKSVYNDLDSMFVSIVDGDDFDEKEDEEEEEYEESAVDEEEDNEADEEEENEADEEEENEADVEEENDVDEEEGVDEEEQNEVRDDDDGGFREPPRVEEEEEKDDDDDDEAIDGGAQQDDATQPCSERALSADSQTRCVALLDMLHQLSQDDEDCQGLQAIATNATLMSAIVAGLVDDLPSTRQSAACVIKFIAVCSDTVRNLFLHNKLVANLTLTVTRELGSARRSALESIAAVALATANKREVFNRECFSDVTLITLVDCLLDVVINDGDEDCRVAALDAISKIAVSAANKRALMLVANLLPTLLVTIKKQQMGREDSERSASLDILIMLSMARENRVELLKFSGLLQLLLTVISEDPRTRVLALNIFENISSEESIARDIFEFEGVVDTILQVILHDGHGSASRDSALRALVNLGTAFENHTEIANSEELLENIVAIIASEGDCSARDSASTLIAQLSRTTSITSVLLNSGVFPAMVRILAEPQESESKGACLASIQNITDGMERERFVLDDALLDALTQVASREGECGATRDSALRVLVNVSASIPNHNRMMNSPAFLSAISGIITRESDSVARDAATVVMAQLAKTVEAAPALIGTGVVPAMIDIIRRAGEDMSHWRDGTSAECAANTFFMNVAGNKEVIAQLRVQGIAELLAPLSKQSHFQALKALATIACLCGHDDDGEEVPRILNDSKNSIDRNVEFLSQKLILREDVSFDRSPSDDVDEFSLQTAVRAVRELAKSENLKEYLLCEVEREFHNVPCDGCECFPIIGPRYKLDSKGRNSFCLACKVEREKEEGEEVSFVRLEGETRVRPSVFPLLHRVVWDYVEGGWTSDMDAASASLAVDAMFDLSLTPLSNAISNSVTHLKSLIDTKCDYEITPIVSVLEQFVFSSQATSSSIANASTLIVRIKASVSTRSVHSNVYSKQVKKATARFTASLRNAVSAKAELEEQLDGEADRRLRRDEKIRKLADLQRDANTEEERKIRELERRFAEQEALRGESQFRETKSLYDELNTKILNAYAARAISLSGEERTAALTEIWELSADKSTHVQIFSTPEFMKALVNDVLCGKVEENRELATGIVWFISRNDENRRPLFEFPGLIEILLDIVFGDTGRLVEGALLPTPFSTVPMTATASARKDVTFRDTETTPAPPSIGSPGGPRPPASFSVRRSSSTIDHELNDNLSVPAAPPGLQNASGHSKSSIVRTRSASMEQSSDSPVDRSPSSRRSTASDGRFRSPTAAPAATLGSMFKYEFGKPKFHALNALWNISGNEAVCRDMFFVDGLVGALLAVVTGDPRACETRAVALKVLHNMSLVSGVRREMYQHTSMVRTVVAVIAESAVAGVGRSGALLLVAEDANAAAAKVLALKLLEQLLDEGENCRDFVETEGAMGALIKVVMDVRPSNAKARDVALRLVEGLAMPSLTSKKVACEGFLETKKKDKKTGKVSVVFKARYFKLTAKILSFHDYPGGVDKGYIDVKGSFVTSTSPLEFSIGGLVDGSKAYKFRAPTEALKAFWLEAFVSCGMTKRS